jgi:polysaccharide deacetylase family protein (PEP-CTERM system associated)
VKAPIVNAMTVDVEEHFHVSAFEDIISPEEWHLHESRVVANTERMLALFDRHAIKATFFILGTVADHHPSLVRHIVAGGHEVASHGYSHQLIYDQTPGAFREDVRRAKGVLESLIGHRVAGYRAPSYSITEDSLWALDILIEEGHAYDASIFPIRHDRYGIPGAPRHPHTVTRVGGSIVEVPASTIRLGPMNLPMAGGGYFRLLPYYWTRHGFRRLNHDEERPAVFYLHPWEVDPDQPRIAANPLSQFRHYRNLHRTADRLERLVGEFRFAPVRDVIAPLLHRAH